MNSQKIRVLVVDDSLVCREMITQILESDSGIIVAGQAVNGKEAIERVKEINPDIITMDIHMPEMNGILATEYIMAIKPTPILIVSSSVDDERTSSAFEALSKGALDVLKKPEPVIWEKLANVGDDLIKKVKFLSKIRVIKHIGGLTKKNTRAEKLDEVIDYRILAIGSSTGGPNALLKILRTLPRDFPIPVVIAQHITDGFVGGMIEWLGNYCALNLKLARSGESLSKGNVYISPTGKHLTILIGGLIRLKETISEDLYRPSVNKLFESVANSFQNKAIGVILTGMGSDGASGLKMIKKAGGLTIDQDEQSSVVYGMPKAAYDIGAVTKVASIDEIPQLIFEATMNLKIN